MPLLTNTGRHRKCDRALPRCGQCIAHSGECLFEAPHKRGPRGKNVATFTYSPYGQPKPSTTATSPTPQKSTPPPGTVALPHDADVQLNMKEANMSYVCLFPHTNGVALHGYRSDKYLL